MAEAHHDHHAHHGHGDTTLGSSAQATLHCLTGCIIGEVAGLAIGTTLGIGVFWTIVLAVVLAYISGFSLAIFPLMKRESLTFMQALSVIWLGEAISIGAMEIAMNGVDYAVGGMGAGSVLAPMFWIGLAAAAPAGFLAAWPVNYYLLKRQLKRCH
jgi:hypothetical protein